MPRRRVGEGLGMRSIIASVVALASLTAVPAPAAVAPVWTADLVHSRAEFRVTHLLLSKVWGHVPFRSMQIDAGENGMPVRSVNVVLDLAHEDTDNHTRDADLRSPAYFDTATYPTIAFASTKVVPGADPASFEIDGNLTIHGVTKPVVLAAKYEGKVPEGDGGTRVGYTASTTIDRRDYGLTSALMSPANIPIVGNEVDIELTVEMTSPAR